MAEQPGLRNRMPGLGRRGSSNSPAPSQMPRRRSSMVSLGAESVSSFRSTTDDLLLPRVSNSGLHDEPSALHSAPLFLAIVPAIAGLAFKDGSSIMTDLTLLVLAAVLLNWSIRLPWDWYHSAQAVRAKDSINTEDYLPMEMSQETIVEEEEEEVDDPDAAGKEPKSDEQQSSKSGPSKEQLAAASSLRMHELLALIACFLGPMAGAWLLHSIRSQLSRPSEGLVSNYNLTIFLLAAEIRPLSHFIKLIQNRTLHLQRVVAQNPHAISRSGGPGISPDEITALASRVSALEGSPANGTDAKGPDSPSAFTSANREALLQDVRRSLQPDIDALNRAVRRYEKRATLLSMQVDGRLNTLEARLHDTLALAAAAERNVSGAKKGSAGLLLDWVAGIVVLPLQAFAWATAKALELPGKLLATLAQVGKEIAEQLLPRSWMDKLQGTLSKSADRPKTRQREKERPKGSKKAA